MILPFMHILRNVHLATVLSNFLGGVSHKWLNSEVQVLQGQPLKLESKTSLGPLHQVVRYTELSRDLRLGNWIYLIFTVRW